MKQFISILLLAVIVIGLASCQTRSKERLYVFNWTDYIDPDLVRQFEKMHNCKVVPDYYSSNEDMFTKLTISNSRYDIIVPSGYYISVLLEEGLLEKIDISQLENYKNLDETLLEKAREYDFEDGYVVPYFWGTSGIIYNNTYLSDEDMTDVSWNIFADKEYTGNKMLTMLDDMREVIGIALLYNGYDPNEYSDEAIAKARETLLVWDRNVIQYDSDSYKNEVQVGTIWMAMAYNGDALQVMEENENIGFTLPREGSTLWIDFLAIPKNAENKELALKFIDFLLDAKVALANAEYVMYPTPNKAAFELLPQEIQENENIYLTEEYLEKSHFIKDIGDEIRKYDVVWQEIKNN